MPSGLPSAYNFWNMKAILFSATLIASAFALFAPSTASAYPRTKERATLTLTFDLVPMDPASLATGTATIDVTRKNGVETAGPVELELTGLADGSYTLEATTKADPAGARVFIATVDVSSAPVDPAAPAPAPITLPVDLQALEIDTLFVSDVADIDVLSGTASETVANWLFFGNRPIIPVVVATDPSTAQPVITGKKPRVKKIHGHVLIQNVIKNDVEKRRKFLLVGHNFLPNTEYTIQLDGVDVGTVITTKVGKAMLRRLDGDFRLAGVHVVSIVDAAGTVIAEADFFPHLE